VGDVAAAVTPATSIVAFVSPNNPTGSVGTADDLRALAAAAPNAILLADFAYIEFADRDLTDVALSLPNCVVVRTLSKAYGLAGLRVGYAIGPREVIGWMRAAGGPYAVARPSVALAMARLTRDDGGMKRFVEQVRADRLRVEETLAAYGATSTRSQGNFVYTTMDDPLWVRDILAGLGIAIRAYPGHPRQGNSLRITLPGNQGECDRLIHALRSAFSPEAIIVPHEGVLESIEASTAEREAFGKLALRVPVGVCSNALRPAVDSLINRHGIQHLVKALVTEALLPPRTLEKSYLRLAEGLAARRVWALVTNRMEVEAARSQRMVPIAIVPKGPDSAVGRGLLQAGAAVVLPRLTDVLARLHNMPTAMLGN
jgi:phosphoglycolate phosphatase-like HAD superfamily hydrolase